MRGQFCQEKKTAPFLAYKKCSFDFSVQKTVARDSSLIKMSDTRYWSKEFLSEFIELYKKYPCLWKIKSKEYTNKNLKNKAYDVLVSHCKRNYPEANRDFVAKKIQSIRGSFRKELLKISNSKKSGVGEESVHKPSLWYFDLLQFTTEQEEPTASISNLDEDSYIESNEGDDEGTDKVDDPKENKSHEEAEQLIHTLKEGPKRKTISSSTPNQPKRKKVTCNEEFMEVCKNALQKSADMTEYEAIGISVAKKLQRMDPIQALYADSVINEVLKRGLLKKLTENTTITERPVLFSPVETVTCYSADPSRASPQDDYLMLEVQEQMTPNLFQKHPDSFSQTEEIL